MAWNRPSEEKKVEVEGKGRQWNGRLKGLIAGAIVVLGAGIAAWWLWPEGGARQDAASTKKGLIKEVAPSLAPTNTVAKRKWPKYMNVPEDWDKPYPPEAYWPDGSLKAHTRWVYSHTNKVNSLYVSEEAKIFPERGVNLELGEILAAEPGEVRIGEHKYGEKFVRKFLKSLEKPIVISASDSEYAKELKRAVIDAKKELKARYDAGEDIAQIMNDNETQMRELSLYRKELEDQIRQIKKEKRGELDSKDLTELYGAANKMLNDRGVKPLVLPQIAIERMKLKESKAEMKGALK